jgi:hypothetical protein
MSQDTPGQNSPAGDARSGHEGDGGDAGVRLEDLLRRQDHDHEDHDDAIRPDQAGDTENPGNSSGPTDRAALSEPPLFALLTSIEREITVERIDRIWIFPPRRFDEGETAVVVVSAFPALDPERRTVYAAHYTAPADAGEPRLALQEFGTAPTERVGRIVEDVVGRLKDEAPAAPAATRIQADHARWHEMRHALAEQHLDQTSRHPRLQGPRPARPGPS